MKADPNHMLVLTTEQDIGADNRTGPESVTEMGLSLAVFYRNKPELQVLVYGILPSTKVPESDARSVERTLSVQAATLVDRQTRFIPQE